MSEIQHDDAVQHPSGLPLAHWLTLTAVSYTHLTLPTSDLV